MFAGFVMVFTWELLIKSNVGGIGGLISGVLANLVFLLISDYTLNQKGGWIGIKKSRSIQENKRKKREAFYKSIRSFNLIDACEKNTPKNDVIIAIFGLSLMASMYVEKSKEEVVFTIEDEGDGIPVREIYDIFTPFKMSSKHQTSNAGRGVGLALCRAAVNAHGGEIKAESNGIRGARFTLVLPC